MPDGKNGGAPAPAQGTGLPDPTQTMANYDNTHGKNAATNQADAQKAAHTNSQGPNGSNTFTLDPATGQYTQTSGFSGPLAGANGILQQQALDQFGKPLPDGSAARDQAINAAYGQATSRLDPRFAQEGEQLQSQLAAQGLDPSSQAYQTSMGNFGREKNDAYNQAMYGAIGQGTQAGAQLFNEGVISRNMPLGELGQMQGLLPGASDNRGLDAWNSANNYTGQQQNAAAQDITGGVQAAGSVAGAGVKYSDARLKDDIQPLPFDATDGVPFSTFRYSNDPSGQPYVGVIAQDLEKKDPTAVSHDMAGNKMVSPEYQAIPISPEEKAAIQRLNVTPEKQAELERQYARAAALRKGSGRVYTHPLAAALGGIGDAVDKVSGAVDEKRLDAQSQGLIQQMGQGRSAAGDVAQRQQDADMAYQQALIAALRGGGNGG